MTRTITELLALREGTTFSELLEALPELFDAMERMKDALKQAEIALEESDQLIKHQYTGSREAMSDLTYANIAARDALVTIRALIEEPKL